MHKVILLSLLALSVSAHGADKSHRLAYSKAENVEVFVDHSEAQPWCSATLNLRFAFTGEANIASVERLLPKLGGLFGAQCPAASELSWKSLNQNGQLQAQGSASKAAGWVAQIAQSAAPVAVVPAVVTETAPAVAAVAAPAAAEPVAETPPPTTPVAAATASAPAVVAAPAVVSVDAEPVKAVAPVIVDDFAVAGWKIPVESEVLAAAKFLTVLQDQNGCKFRTSYKPEDSGAALSAQSAGISCGADGFASGTGELLVQRSDGVELKRFKGFFHKGFAISDGIAELPIVAFDDDGNLFMLLSSDPVSRVHYLLRASHSSYSGTWNMNSLLVVALTENVELFRQI